MPAVPGLSLYAYNNPYTSVYTSGLRRGAAAQQPHEAQARGVGRTAVIPAAQTGTPVQPVDPVRAPSSVALDQKDLMGRLENDPAANAARSRMQYSGERPGTLRGPDQLMEQSIVWGSGPASEKLNVPGSFQAEQNSGSYSAQRAVGDMTMPDTASSGALSIPNGVPTPHDTDFPADQEADASQPGFPDLPGAKKDGSDEVGSDTKSAQETAEESECQTCKNRKYQDGSDDPGVSFKTPTHIDPDQAMAAVAGHENEHVVRNQAEARREDRRVVSQSVTYHSAICPECGRVYISGGTTRTVTAANPEAEKDRQEDLAGKVRDKMAVEGVLPGQKGEDGKAAVKGLFPGQKDEDSKFQFRLPGQKDGESKFPFPGQKDNSGRGLDIQNALFGWSRV